MDDYDRIFRHSGIGGSGVPTDSKKPVALPNWSWEGIALLCVTSVAIVVGFVKLIKWIV